MAFLSLKKRRTVVAWDNFDNQCEVPTGLTNVVAIAAGLYHSYFKQDGTVVAWGDKTSDQCNVPFELKDVVDIAGRSTLLGFKTRWYGRLGDKVDMTSTTHPLG